jgi:hypothetical protein
VMRNVAASSYIVVFVCSVLVAGRLEPKAAVGVSLSAQRYNA